MGVYIAGIGTAKTDYVDTAEAADNGWYDPEELGRSELRSITVAGSTPAPDLAIEAARTALEHSGHEPAEINALFHTCVHPQGPDGWSAQHYINRNTINQPVTSIEIRNACVGFFASLQLASCYLTNSPVRTAVLLTAADNFNTPAINRWHASRLFVLADGGGAVVLSRSHGFAKVLAVQSVSDPELEAHHRGRESMFPPSLTIGAPLNFDERTDYGQYLADEGVMPPLWDFGAVLVEAVEQVLKDANTSMDDIVRVVHDGFARWAINDILLGPLGLDEERGIWEFTSRHGHAGALDHIRGLEYLWRNGIVGVGDKVLLMGKAPGMEASCAVLEICEAP
jgi:3-oxoacyl-[acyl-carrier-protein] synthase III